MPARSPPRIIWLRLAYALRLRPLGLKAVSFGIVGVASTVIDVGAFFLLVNYVTGSLIIANVAAWFVSTTCSYVINAFTTFSTESGGELRLRDYVGVLGSGVLSAIVSTTTVVMAASLMPVWAAKCVGIVISSTSNFLMANFVVFRKSR
jgi:putative flippase GtrA